MKKSSKNIYDDITVDEIPKGKESDYYSLEESAQIKENIEKFIKFRMVLFVIYILITIAHILKLIFGFSDWLKIVVYIISPTGLILIIIGIIKYVRLLKFVKNIPRDKKI